VRILESFRTLSVAVKLAKRELRSGLAGFRIFFACLVLGVTVVAGVGSLAHALMAGIHTQGRTILGGDVAIGLVHRQATLQERAFFSAYGSVSETTSMRAMAYALKKDVADARQLVELKAIDGAYPLFGSVSLSPAVDLRAALACRSKICGAVVEQTLLDRLGIGRGDTIRIGNITFQVTAVLTSEPDRLAENFSLGPHVIVSDAGLARTGLVTLGSLINYNYRVALARGRSIDSFKSEAAKRFPDAGFQITDRDHAAPGTEMLIAQVSMFLTLVGLTALAVAGVGAGQAIRAYLDRKREAIATLKALGAESQLIFTMFLVQVMSVSVLAIAVGLVLGSILPFAMQGLYGASIPIPAQTGVFAQPLLLAAIFGFFSALAFSVLPLSRAREITPGSLFRDIVAPLRVTRWPYRAAAAGCALIVIGVAVAVSPSLSFAGWFLLGASGTLILLRAAAECLHWLVRGVPRVKHPALRLALGNLTRPGSAMAAVVVSLGLGLTLLAAVMLIDATLMAQVKAALPASAPTFYFIDIQPGDAKAFDATIAQFRSARDYQRTPMIRGRIVALNGVPAKSAKVATGARWALNGDRGITYAARAPRGTELVEGHWWPATYAGPTLISFDADLARDMGLKLGNTLTLNVLGREITGRIFNFREVHFSNGRQNFVLILSPGLIDKAPHSYLATLRVAPKDENALYRAVTNRFASVSVVRVKDVIAQIESVFQALGAGVRAASLITILAGLLVLAGAIAAGQRDRLYDATVMKVVGATRVQITLVYAFEYGLLGGLAGAVALVAGTAAGYGVARWVFEVPFIFDVRTLLLIVMGGGALTVVFGLLAALADLAAKPAQRLRNP
jgi:putative ABC transport system permease protein